MLVCSWYVWRTWLSWRFLVFSSWRSDFSWWRCFHRVERFRLPTSSCSWSHSLHRTWKAKGSFWSGLHASIACNGQCALKARKILKVSSRCTCDPQRVETCEQGTFLSILGFHGHSHQTPTPMFWLVDPRQAYSSGWCCYYLWTSKSLTVAFPKHQTSVLNGRSTVLGCLPTKLDKICVCAKIFL